ncbi:MAG: molybdopterin-guanine dinucleotide biosynthesis protein B [bacterium]
MIPTISIVGRSKAGKTILIEKLIPEIKRRGYRVATIKHDVHNFDIDKEGKDSWRHAQAGAEVVFISCPAKLAMIKKARKELSLNKIITSFIDEVDLILTEGYKRETYPKIEVFIKKGQAKLLCEGKSDNLVAIVSDQVINKDIPCFDFNETVKIVDFLEKKFIKVKNEGIPTVNLRVNGKEIRIKGFIRNIMSKTVLGMISSLKGIENPKQVEIKIRVEGR